MAFAVAAKMIIARELLGLYEMNPYHRRDRAEGVVSSSVAIPDTCLEMLLQGKAGGGGLA